MLPVYIVGSIALILGLSVLFGAPYVPTRRKDLRRMLDHFVKIESSDTVLDFGSGDGVVLREVSRRGGRAIGYEVHPLFVAVSRLLSANDERVSVRWVNGWTTPFPDSVTLVYIFSIGRDGGRLKRKMQEEASRLGRPLRLVCYGNPLPGLVPTKEFEAYFMYTFIPLH